MNLSERLPLIQPSCPFKHKPSKASPRLLRDYPVDIEYSFSAGVSKGMFTKYEYES
jgi:hypothetical protein